MTSRGGYVSENYGRGERGELFEAFLSSGFNGERLQIFFDSGVQKLKAVGCSNCRWKEVYPAPAPDNSTATLKDAYTIPVRCPECGEPTRF